MFLFPEYATSRRARDYPKLPNIAPRPAGTCMVQNSIPPKKTRASKPKVRSGCNTCKTRRVKCDEEKPTCQRCKNADLECDGYGSQLLQASPKEIHTAVILKRPLLACRNPWPAVLGQQDVIYFDLFRTQLVHDLSGYSCSDFWSRIVLCDSMRDKCVLEAVLAIGALSTAVTLASQLHDQPSLSTKWPSALHPRTGESMVNCHHKAAVGHYVKTLSLFRSRVAAGTAMTSPRSVLIMSLLFITFEMLQGDMKTVDCLITSSINLLKDTLELHRQDVCSNDSIQSFRRAKEDDMEDIEHLLPLISIMSGYTPFLISQYANFRLWDTSNGHDFPRVSQSSIGKLQIHWSKFYTRTAAFIGGVLVNLMLTKTPPPSAEEQQRALIAQLKVWEIELDTWQAKIKVYEESTCRTVQVMQIQHLMLLICVSSCLDATQLAFDSREADFKRLLTRCAIFLHEARPTYLFTLNTFIVSALTITVAKCRVHNIRLMAIVLLRQLSWREGAWDATLMMYGKLGGVLLEERARDRGGLIAPEDRWVWTGGDWDVEGGVLVAMYTRAVPDEAGLPVQKILVLDLERYPDVCSEIGCVADHVSECGRLYRKQSL